MDHVVNHSYLSGKYTLTSRRLPLRTPEKTLRGNAIVHSRTCQVQRTRAYFRSPRLINIDWVLLPMRGGLYASISWKGESTSKCKRVKGKPDFEMKAKYLSPYSENWIMLLLSPGFPPSERNRKQSGTLLFNTFNFLPRFWYPSALPSSPFFFASLRSTMVLPIWFGCTFGLSGFFMLGSLTLWLPQFVVRFLLSSFLALLIPQRTPKAEKREKTTARKERSSRRMERGRK